MSNDESNDKLIGGGTIALGSAIALMGMLNIDTRVVDISSFLRNNRIFPEGLLPTASIDTSVAIGLGAIGAGGGIIYAGAKQLKKDDKPLSEKSVAGITEIAFGSSLFLPSLLSLLITRETNDVRTNIASKAFFVMSSVLLNVGQGLTLVRKDLEEENKETGELKWAEGLNYAMGGSMLILHLITVLYDDSGTIRLYRNELRHLLFSLLGISGSIALTNGTYKLLRDQDILTY